MSSLQSTPKPDDASEKLQVLPSASATRLMRRSSSVSAFINQQLQAHAASLFEATDDKFLFPLPVKGSRARQLSISQHSSSEPFFRLHRCSPHPLPLASPPHAGAIIAEGLAFKDGHFLSSSPKQVGGRELMGAVGWVGHNGFVSVMFRV
jgi:hypothetical protein